MDSSNRKTISPIGSSADGVYAACRSRDEKHAFKRKTASLLYRLIRGLGTTHMLGTDCLGDSLFLVRRFGAPATVTS